MGWTQSHFYPNYRRSNIDLIYLILYHNTNIYFYRYIYIIIMLFILSLCHNIIIYFDHYISLHVTYDKIKFVESYK
jgi:hypothetical protein